MTNEINEIYDLTKQILTENDIVYGTQVNPTDGAAISHTYTVVKKNSHGATQMFGVMHTPKHNRFAIYNHEGSLLYVKEYRNLPLGNSVFPTTQTCTTEEDRIVEILTICQEKANKESIIEIKKTMKTLARSRAAKQAYLDKIKGKRK